MSFVYNFFIFIYNTLLHCLAPFHSKASLWVKGRKNIFNDIESRIKVDDLIIWFHSASLGEFEQGRPVIEGIKEKYPQYKILLTFFSPSGYEIRKNYAGADYIFYLPIDFPINAKKFIQITRPQAVFFIKYEFWYNYLKQLHLQNIPVYLISANFRPNQLFFKWYGGWYREMLKYFKHFFVQNNQSLKLLQSISIDNVTISGDTRFDRVKQIASQTKSLPNIEKFRNDSNVLIAGSTWPADEAILAQFINESKNKFKYIIAPHEIHQHQIESFIQAIPTKKCLKYSDIEKVNAALYDVLIIDNIGMLSSLYKYGIISYIGGGFGKGIHNILEAATFGLPILFGPKYKKFQEAVDLVELGGAYSIDSFEKLKEKTDHLTSNYDTLIVSGRISRDYVKNNTGATHTILSFVIL